MSGSAGLRGYMVQTLIYVLDAVNGKADWSAVTAEPAHESEKFDLLWELPTSRYRATQIKSSEAQISLANVKEWIAIFTGRGKADEYELVLVGPVSGAVADLREHGGVRIPTPQPLNLESMLAQAAHGIDVLRDRLGLARVGPGARIAIAQGLVVDGSLDAIRSRRVTRESLVERIAEAIQAIERGTRLERVVITIDAPNDPEIVDAIMRALRIKGGDYSFQLETVRIGSLILCVEGTSGGVSRLMDAFESGALASIAGFRVTALQRDSGGTAVTLSDAWQPPASQADVNSPRNAIESPWSGEDLFEAALLYEIGLLEREKITAFETALALAPPALREQIQKACDRLADSQVKKMSRVHASHLRAPQLLPSRGVSPYWRAASIGCVTAMIVIGFVTVELSRSNKNEGFALAVNSQFATSAEMSKLLARFGDAGVKPLFEKTSIANIKGVIWGGHTDNAWLTLAGIPTGGEYRLVVVDASGNTRVIKEIQGFGTAVLVLDETIARQVASGALRATFQGADGRALWESN